MNHILKCHEIVKTDFVRGQGPYLYDAQGKKYIDFEAGIWCAALGHNHPRINHVIRSQIKQITHLGTRYLGAIAEEAAVEVLGLVGIPDGKCVFLSSGSEAVEFAVQATRRLTDRPLLLTLSDSYLAAYGSAGRKSPDEWHCFDWGPCAGCHQQTQCNAQCEHIQAIPFERIGGFVFEPGSTSGQIRFPPKGLVRLLADQIRQQRSLLVINEITTGMGRTGTWFGYQHYDLQPDIVSMGKGLGNGYPVSAVAMSRNVTERLEAGEFRYAQSHQNDPLGCAVAREVIHVLREDGLIERSNRVGVYFLQELNRLGEWYAVVKEARGRGLMIALEFDSRREGFSVARLYRELLDRGFIVGYHPAANLLRFQPPLIIGEQDIAVLLENLKQII